MKPVHDLRKLKLGQAYNFREMPGGRKVFGYVGDVKPNMDHVNWGSVYDRRGILLVSASYGEWLEAEEFAS